MSMIGLVLAIMAGSALVAILVGYMFGKDDE